MDNQPQWRDRGTNRWAERVEHTAGNLNVVLLVVAIGLAMLDVTCFLALKAREALPSPALAAANAAAVKPIAAPNQPTPAVQGQAVAGAGQSVAVLMPTKPSASVTGW